jgi:ABC-2 type transport system permease protein
MTQAHTSWRRSNLLGLWTLTRKEIYRFLKVPTQTVLAPMSTTLLYYAVFSLALGGAARQMGGVPFIEFLLPGLIMMSMAQNAFANTSSSLVIAKVQGNIVDVLLPPLSPAELMIGYATGSVMRGVIVGTVSLLVIVPFAALGIAHVWAILFYGIMGCLMLGLLGLAGGIWSDKFDHLAAVTNFIIMPATFLSGTFYTADKLPQGWQFICHLNPFFYMIDGFRYGFTGTTDGTLGTGVLVLLSINLVLTILCYSMLKTGYKLKA